MHLAEPVELLAQVTRPADQVLNRIMGIDAEFFCGGGHQLRKPQRAFWRDRPRVISAFLDDHRVE